MSLALGLIVTGWCLYTTMTIAKDNRDIVFTKQTGCLGIMSWNVGGIFTDPLKILRLSTYIMRSRREYDVICLQECFFPWVYVPIRLALLGWYVEWMPGDFSPFQVGGGVCIASKYPLLNSRFTPFTYSNGFDRLSQKGMLKVDVVTKRGMLVVTGTHMQDSKYDDDGMIRRSQTMELKTYCKLSDIVIGDFNVCADRDTDLLENLETSIAPSCVPTCATVKEGNIFDYALVNEKHRISCSVRQDSGEMSDHYPVCFKLKV